MWVKDLSKEWKEFARPARAPLCKVTCVSKRHLSGPPQFFRGLYWPWSTVRIHSLLAQDWKPWAVHILYHHPRQLWGGFLRGRRGFHFSSRCSGPDSTWLHGCHKQILPSPLRAAGLPCLSTSRPQANGTAWGLHLSSAAYMTLGKLSVISLCFNFPIWKMGMVIPASLLLWEAGGIILCETLSRVPAPR